MGLCISYSLPEIAVSQMRFRVVTKTNVPEHSQENNYCRSSQDSNIYMEKKSSLNRVILQSSNKIPTRHLRLTNTKFSIRNGLPLLKFCMIIFGVWVDGKQTSGPLLQETLFGTLQNLKIRCYCC